MLFFASSCTCSDKRPLFPKSMCSKLHIINLQYINCFVNMQMDLIRALVRAITVMWRWLKCHQRPNDRS